MSQLQLKRPWFLLYYLFVNLELVLAKTRRIGKDFGGSFLYRRIKLFYYNKTIRLFIY